MSQKLSPLQELILKAISSNTQRTLYSQKIGYRTRHVSGNELHGKIQKLRIFLDNNKIKKGDKIIILGYSSIEWVVVYLACILSGIIVVPVDVMSDKKLVKKINNQVNAKAIFQREFINHSIRNVKSYLLEELENHLDDGVFKEIPYPEIKPNDIIEIQYTSGTTGDPKGVILTHDNIYSAVQVAVKTINIRLHLRFLNVLPLSHIFAQIMGLFLPLHFGYNVFFTDTVQPRKLIALIRNKRIHAAIFVPGILANLREHLEDKCVACNLGIQFRIIGVGGAALEPEVEKWWKRKYIFVLQGYGLTETAAVVSINAPFASRTGSAGKIAYGISVKLGPDKEILVKGANISIGYYLDKEKTKASFENGWFKTGDVGEIKDDYLYIKERKKDIIITPSGLKAYPSDIEPVLNSINGVKESCVVQKDNKVQAILILEEGKNPKEIIKQANEKLLSHQKIAGYTVWKNEFPKTPTGKVKKFILMKELGSNRAALEKFSYEKKLFKIIDQILVPGKKINQSSNLVDIGMDSLKRIELITELENHFDVEIDEMKLDQNTTVFDLEKLTNQRVVYRIKFRSWPTTRLFEVLRKVYQKLLVFPIASFFTKTQYFGLDNLEGIKYPVIFVSNHQSAFDVPLMIKHIKIPLAVAADGVVVFGIGVKGFIKRNLKKMLGYYSIFSYNAFPFGATIGIDESMDFMGEMMDRKFSVIFFPEGKRTLDGKIHEFKSGVGLIVTSMKIPIVPVRLKGLFEVLPIGKTIPKFGKTSVTFGKLIDPSEITNKPYKEIARILEQKVGEL